MRLAVGEAVVYRNHGVGRVVAREKGTLHGEPSEVVVLALDEGLTVTLPLPQALEQLRPVADEEALRRIEKTLRADRELRTGPWLSRRNELQAKLAASDPVLLAEVVVEGAQRERLRLESGTKSPLSPGEHSIFQKARNLLLGEIAVARGLDLLAAEVWIQKQLARPESPPAA
jgi:RNA polymerase-interacting CarD/CdnL/TRCF family regulator